MSGSKGAKNLFFGLIAQVLTIAVGIIIPRLVLVNLGSEANGLLNSVSSILTYMALLEAGVGAATVQALYTPCGKNDHDKINRIMAATNYFYRRTGTIYLIIVMILSVGYTLMIDSTIPRIYIFLVVILSGLSGVLSYFIQGKYKLLLMAEGRNYVITNITTISSIGISIVKVLVLITGGNVVAMQSTYFVFNLLQMLIIVLYIHRNYHWLDLKVEPDFSSLDQRNAVMIHQITELIFNNTDVIILTLFTTLKSVSVYSMYAMIFGMVKSVAVTFSDSYSYAVGQSWEDKDRFNRIFNGYEVYNMTVTFAFFCIATILMLPFLKLYTRGINDINYVDPYLLALFAACQLMQNGRKASQTVINVAQHFEKTKWRSVAEAIINLTVSLALTYKFGIYGVLWGTIAALFYRTNDVIIYAAGLLKRSVLISYRRWFVNLGVFLALVYASGFIPFPTGSYLWMILYGMFLCATVLPIFLLVNSVTNMETAKYTFSVIKRTILKRRG